MVTSRLSNFIINSAAILDESQWPDRLIQGRQHLHDAPNGPSSSARAETMPVVVALGFPQGSEQRRKLILRGGTG